MKMIVPHGSVVTKDMVRLPFGSVPTDVQILERQPVQTDIKMCPGLFVKHCVFAAGTLIPQHSHSTPHLSVIASGEARVWKDGVLLGDFSAPCGVVIEAHSKHTFLALKDNTAILCVHRVEDGEEPDIHEEHQF